MRVLQTIVALALALPVVGTQHLLLSEEEEHHTALRAGHHHDGEHRELTWVAKAVCDNFLANRTFFPNWRDVYCECQAGPILGEAGFLCTRNKRFCNVRGNLCATVQWGADVSWIIGGGAFNTSICYTDIVRNGEPFPASGRPLCLRFGRSLIRTLLSLLTGGLLGGGSGSGGFTEFDGGTDMESCASFELCDDEETPSAIWNCSNLVPGWEVEECTPLPVIENANDQVMADPLPYGNA